ncbi:MAG: hypothetical protein JRF41_15145 [Deltaproteobacteria bacterium]|nr:hypothetical protein [Deltaproteobacteria bacterium]
MKKKQAPNHENKTLIRQTQAFHHAGWGLAVTDPADYKLLEVNPAFARL